jgi:hypothetical protein
MMVDLASSPPWLRAYLPTAPGVGVELHQQAEGSACSASAAAEVGGWEGGWEGGRMHCNSV